MDVVLRDAGLALLKTIGAGLLVLAIGISAAPNLDRAVAIGIAGLIALIAACAAALQAFVPRLSFRAWIAAPWGPMLDSFVHAAIGAFLTSIIGILNMPDLTAWKALVVAAIIGAVNAGLRAIQGSLTPGEAPAVSKGVRVPRQTPTRTTVPVLLPA